MGMQQERQVETTSSREPNNILSTTEAAERLGLSRSTLEKLRVSGRGPAFVKLGHTVRYRPADMEQWLLDCRVTSTSQRVTYR